MRVRRFVAPDVQVAMAKVKAEMGDEAVILHVRTVRAGGFFGLFGRSMTEVTAALEDRKGSFPPQQEMAPKLARTYERADIVKVEPVQEIRQLKHAIEKMSREMQQQMAELGADKSLQGMEMLLKEFTDKELDERLVKKVLKNILAELGEEASPEQVRAELTGELTKLVGQVSPIIPNGKKPLVVALVGPTGVGKTTTIAKLAANFCLVQNYKVAMLTADTYRVAAIDQLKTFAEIIRVPLEVVVSTNTIRDAIERQKDADVIFIDTAGRSPNNQMQISELRALMEKAKPDRVLLTMSATTRRQDMDRIVEKFDLPCIDSLIFTKMDETTSCGAIISIMHKTQKPLAYLTNGQTVPDDIVLDNPHLMVGRVLGGDELHA